jgi:hypothetical protein
MRNAVCVLIALLLAGAGAAQDSAGPSVHEPDAATSAPAPTPTRPVPPVSEAFQLFTQIAPAPRVALAGVAEDRRLFHQPGDPDSQFTLGKPSPEGEVHVLAVIDVNEIFLKAIPPDPLVSGNDTRPRAAGSFLPVDTSGRPYQLRLGARLVW